jgi:hypothetical protein
MTLVRGPDDGSKSSVVVAKVELWAAHEADSRVQWRLVGETALRGKEVFRVRGFRGFWEEASSLPQLVHTTTCTSTIQDAYLCRYLYYLPTNTTTLRI